MSSSEIPDDLKFLCEFLNTRWPDMSDWLHGHGLSTDPARLEADREEAIAVRNAVRQLIAAGPGDPAEADAIEDLNQVAAAHPVAIEFRPRGGQSLRPQRGDSSLSKLLAIVYRSMSTGSWSRVKLCQDETCRFVFYDQSRNRSGIWCSMAVCGNRNKVRAYTQRAKARAAHS